jgi:predicted nucleotidyltransferase
VPAKSASTRVSAKTSAKSVRASVPEPRRKKVRMSKLEAERLESFKALMKKYGGKLTFAGFDEPFSATSLAKPRGSVGLSREEIVERLRENEAALRSRGVAHAALFGSRVRGEARPESDTDIMIEFDPAARITVFDYAGLKNFVAGLFDGPVDVVNGNGLKPHLKAAAMLDAHYAF